jgi:hypothetical protein
MIRAYQIRPKTVHWIYYSSVTNRWTTCTVMRTAAIMEFLATQKGHMCEEIRGGENELMSYKRRLLSEGKNTARIMTGPTM